MLSKLSLAIGIGAIGLLSYIYLAYFSLPQLLNWPYLAAAAPQVGLVTLAVSCIVAVRLVFSADASREFKIYSSAVFVFFSTFGCSQEAYIKLTAFSSWLKPEYSLEDLWLAYLVPLAICGLALLLTFLNLLVFMSVEDEEDRQRVGGTRGILKFIGLALTTPIITFWVSAALIMNSYFFEDHQVDWLVVAGCVVAILIAAVVSQENYLHWDKALFPPETNEPANLRD